VPVTASVDEIRSATLDVEEVIAQRRVRAAVRRLRDAVATRRRGVAGLGDTLAALSDRRAEWLLVSHGYEAAGWRCAGCATLAVVGRSCPRCGGQMQHIDDVVEEAVEEALSMGCKVDVCRGEADLDVLGRIGALLRY
jgi:peptide subunit release factor 1 (eRF1)